MLWNVLDFEYLPILRDLNSLFICHLYFIIAILHIQLKKPGFFFFFFYVVNSHLMNFIPTNNYPIPVHQNSSEALSENTESFTEPKEGWGCEKQEWLEERTGNLLPNIFFHIFKNSNDLFPGKLRAVNHRYRTVDHEFDSFLIPSRDIRTKVRIWNSVSKKKENLPSSFFPFLFLFLFFFPHPFLSLFFFLFSLVPYHSFVSGLRTKADSSRIAVKVEF